MVAQSSIRFTPKPLAAIVTIAGMIAFSFTSNNVDDMNQPVKTLIYHKVENFDKWKSTFDGAKELRTASGELSYEIGTFRHDPSIAYVVNEWTSVAAFEAFVSQPELGEAMKKAGVLEAPHFIVFMEKEKNAPVGGKINTLIAHPVADFDAWKAVFSSAKELRTAAGELSYEIGVFQTDPRTAYVLNEWNTADEFQSFMARPELGDAMKKAGVLAPPTVFIFDKKAAGK